MGAKAKEINGCKLWYSDFNRARSGVGIFAEELVKQIVEVMR